MPFHTVHAIFLAVSADQHKPPSHYKARQQISFVTATTPKLFDFSMEPSNSRKEQKGEWGVRKASS
jgi:hypothetical protein